MWSNLCIRVDTLNNLPLDTWLENWVSYLRKKGGEHSITYFVNILREIWYTRNKAIFQMKSPNPFEIMRKSGWLGKTVSTEYVGKHPHPKVKNCGNSREVCLIGNSQCEDKLVVQCSNKNGHV